MSVSFEEHHAPNVKSYLMVFGALLVLTVLTVLVSYIHLPMGLAIAVALLIAGVKAGLVGAIFMHLKGERKLIFALLALTVGFVVVMMALSSWDISLIHGRFEHGEKPAGAAAPAHAAPHR